MPSGLLSTVCMGREAEEGGVGGGHFKVFKINTEPLLVYPQLLLHVLCVTRSQRSKIIIFFIHNLCRVSMHGAATVGLG